MKDTVADCDCVRNTKKTIPCRRKRQGNKSHSDLTTTFSGILPSGCKSTYTLPSHAHALLIQWAFFTNSFACCNRCCENGVSKSWTPILVPLSFFLATIIFLLTLYLVNFTTIALGLPYTGFPMRCRCDVSMIFPLYVFGQGCTSPWNRFNNAYLIFTLKEDHVSLKDYKRLRSFYMYLSKFEEKTCILEALLNVGDFFKGQQYTGTIYCFCLPYYFFDWI